MKRKSRGIVERRKQPDGTVHRLLDCGHVQLQGRGGKVMEAERAFCERCAAGEPPLKEPQAWTHVVEETPTHVRAVVHLKAPLVYVGNVFPLPDTAVYNEPHVYSVMPNGKLGTTCGLCNQTNPKDKGCPARRRSA